MFLICRELGIDDPVAWMNAVPSSVVDQWIAWHLVHAEGSQPVDKMMTPEEAAATLAQYGD